jgi:hypothetical protein
MQCRLLIVLRLLIVVGLLLIIIVVGNTSGSNAEGNQLGRSQRGLGAGDGREDWYIRKLLKRLISLAVNDLLIAPHNLKALIQHIHALIHEPACGKATPEHLQDVGAGTSCGGGTTTVGSAEGAAATMEGLARGALGSLGVVG